MRKPILRFNLHKWLQFASLLEHGYECQIALKIMNEDPSILKQWVLENGDYSALLLASSKGKMAQHLNFFLSITTIHEAIQSSCAMVQMQTQLKKEWYQKTSYPILIFFMAFMIITLFSSYVLPQLLTSFREFHHPYLMLILNGVKISAFVLLLCAIVCVFAFFVIQSSLRLKQWFYRKWCHRIPLLKELISYYFAGYLKVLQERGISTIQSFQFLLRLKDNVFVVETAKRLYEKLWKGEDLVIIIQDCPYFCDFLKSNFIMGIHNASLSLYLSTYLQLQKERWFTMLRRITIVVQVIAYSYVALLVICVYQIMLFPLEIIQEM